MKLTVVIFLLLIYSSQFMESVAQQSPIQGTPFIKNFTSSEINGGPQIWSCIQDKRGMIYVSDMSGVIEFNGHEWTRISNANNTIVRKMDIDSLGRIYVGCSNDFGILQPNSRGQMQFESLAGSVVNKGLKFHDIWKVISTRHGVYFCSNQYVFRFYNKKVSVIPVDFLVQDAYLLNDDIYLPTKKGIALLRDTSKVIVQSKVIFDIVPWNDKEYLGINSKNQLVHFNFKSGISALFRSQVHELLKNDELSGICKIDSNSFALYTAGGQIIILSNDGKIIQIINRDNGLMNGIIYYLFVDNEKNLWACMSRGISKIDINYPVVKFSENQNITNNVLSTCLFKGKRYVGTIDGIYYLPPFEIKDPIKSQKFVKIGVNASECWDLKTINGQLYALCGLNFWVINNDKAHLIYEIKPPQKAHCFNISHLFPNVFFIGMRGKLIALKLDNSSVNPKINELIDFKGINEKIRKIECDREGNLWVDTQYNGVYYIRFIDKRLNNYRVTLLGKKNGIKALAGIKTFNVNNEIVLATDSGIIQPVFPKDKNLPDSIIHFKYSTLFGDSIKNTAVFIAKITNEKYLISGYGMHYARLKGGVKSFDSCGFNRMSCVVENISVGEDSIINICSPDGLFCYNSKKHRNLKKTFNTIISRVDIGKDSTLFGGNFLTLADSTRIPSIKQNSELIPTIDYNHNSLTIHFAALCYEDPQLSELKYQLVGFDKAWSNWSTDNKANYTNLKEGKYTFKVIARNVYGVKSNIAEYRFSIAPPWYRTWLAYLFYILISGVFFYLAMLAFSFRLKKQKELLETLIKERTSEIESQTRELKMINAKLIELDKFKQGIMSMIVHDLKNPINAIINASDKNPEMQLVKIKQSGTKMLNLVMNILDVAKYEESKVQLNVENHNLLAISERAIDQILFLSVEKNLTILNHINPEFGICGDIEILQRVFINLLTNSIKYTPNNGTISIQAVRCNLEKTENPDFKFIKVLITDTGIGIEQENIQVVFQKFGQIFAKNSGSVRSTGLGLTYCKIVIEAHGGEIGVISEINKGSTFWFTIPEAGKITGTIQLNRNHNFLQFTTLSDASKNKIKNQLKELRKTEFYKITELDKILQEIEESSDNEIGTWKQLLIQAIENGNETLYKKLIDD